MAVRDPGGGVVRTQTGKLRFLEADDPSLRRATWWDHLWHGDRFRNVVLERLRGAFRRRQKPRFFALIAVLAIIAGYFL